MRTPSGSNDAPFLIDLDPAFTGVNNRLAGSVQKSGHPYYRLNQEILSPGNVSHAQNVRMQDGSADTRPGWWTMPQFSPWDTTLAEDWTTIRGLGVYSDPDGAERMLVACARTVTPDQVAVYLVSDRTNPQPLTVAAGVELPQGVEVTFVQCFNSVVAFRGADLEPLEWRGGTADEWRPISQTEPTEDAPTFLQPCPNADYGIVMADRLFVPYGRDGIVWSDILDYTRFDIALAQVRVNRGEDDKIVALAPYQGNRLVVLKDQSVYLMENVFGDMADVTVDIVTGTPGCVARKTVADVDGDLLWLGPGGVYSMRQTAEGNARGAALPISWPVQGWIDRINWPAAHRALATVDPQRHLYYLAVPVDGSTVPNAVLVYDFAGRQWQSWDTNQHITSGVQFAVTTDLWGERCPFFTCGSNPLDIYAVTPGADCDLKRGATLDWEPLEITTILTTRDYVLGDLEGKRPHSLLANVATGAATVTATVIREGVSEELRVLSGLTRSRLKRTLWNAAAYDPTNAGNDFNAAWRQDYSWLSEDGPACGASGIIINPLQEWQMPVKVRFGDSRTVSLRLESSTGRLRVRSVRAQATGGRREERMKV